MSNTINIGNITVSKFYLGNSSSVKIYLGTTKLYPNEIKDYLRTVARGSGTITLTIGSAVTTSDMTSIAYSTNGTSWSTLNNVDDTTITASVNVSSGDTVYWKGVGVQTAIAAPSFRGVDQATIFSSTCDYDVEGDAMSMLFDDNFEDEEFDSGSTYHLSGLFYKNTHLINASGMTLPASTLYDNDYNDMFNGCSNLLTPPELPATTIGESCYKRMFNGSSNLLTAPELPATTLAEQCYHTMFGGCTSLTTAPDLSATTLVRQCYQTMFGGCTSLNYIKCLATTNLSSTYTSNWVVGVSATGTFVRNADNTSLEYSTSSVPSGWTVTPPYYAWNKADVSDYICDTETYTKYYKEYYQESYNLGNTWQNVTPVQWRQSEDVIEYDSTDCGYVPPVANYFKITSLAANNTITLRNNTRISSGSSFSYSTDNGTTWSSFSLSSGQTQTIATLESGDTILMYGTNTTLGSNYNVGHYFRATGDYEISGEISSLVNGNATDTDLSGKRPYTFAMLFSGDTHLVSAEYLKVSSTALPDSCFNSTFRSCTSLVKAPELPSTVLGYESYSSMFEGCTALAYPPTELNFTTISSNGNSYNRMFCMSRSSKITAAMTYTPKMFGDWGSVAPATRNMQMFAGNGSLTNIYCYWTNSSGTFGNIADWVTNTDDTNVTFYKRSTQSFASGNSGIKTGWTVVNDDTTQPTS